MDPDQDLHRENRRLKALVDDLLLERDAHLNELDTLRLARKIDRATIGMYEMFQRGDVEAKS